MDRSARPGAKASVQPRMGRAAARPPVPSSSRTSGTSGVRVPYSSTTRGRSITTVRNPTTTSATRTSSTPAVRQTSAVASRSLAIRQATLTSSVSRLEMRSSTTGQNNRIPTARQSVSNNVRALSQHTSPQVVAVRHSTSTTIRTRVESPALMIPIQRKSETKAPTRRSQRLLSLRNSPGLPADYSQNRSLLSFENVYYCPICFEDIKKMGRVTLATRCGHVFCKDCLVESSVKSLNCPLCQQKYKVDKCLEIYL